MNYKILALLLVMFVVGCSNDKNAEPAEKSKKSEIIKAAVFKGNGAGAVSVIETLEALKIDTGISAEAISAAEIQQGRLSGFDVIIFPGGSGSKELNNLGESGKQIVRDFVMKEGKGVVGICAGGYLLSSTAGYPNLGMASSVHIDREHYNRGRGLIEFALTPEGKEVFPELQNKRLFVQYYDGPVLTQSDSTAGSYTEAGTFVSDIHPDGFAPAGITPGRTFLLYQDCGKGKLFISAGHPESTPGMRWMVPRMVRKVCDAPLVGYSSKWVRPGINDKEIIFDNKMKKYEKQLFWKLFSENADEQIAAMDSLYALRSRPAVRWSIGMLRSLHPETRLHAARLLKETEYSFALPDLRQALEKETDNDVKEALKEAIEFLEKP